MDINMDIKGYLLLISKDITFHSRYSCVYPAISSMSSNSFIDIQLFILEYPALCPGISTSYPPFYPLNPAFTPAIYPFES
jgi:hypothetical protein